MTQSPAPRTSQLPNPTPRPEEGAHHDESRGDGQAYIAQCVPSAQAQHTTPKQPPRIEPTAP